MSSFFTSLRAKSSQGTKRSNLFFIPTPHLPRHAKAMRRGKTTGLPMDECEKNASSGCHNMGKPVSLGIAPKAKYKGTTGLPVGCSIILLVSYCCLLFSPSIYAEQTPDLEFTAFFEKDEYKANEQIYINFKIRNNGDQAIYVNKRFYVNSQSASPQDREVFLRVTGPAGEELPSKADYDTGFPKSNYFVLLEPKEEATSERKRNFKAYFDTKDPGEYNIIATYQNVYGAEIGLDAFKGKLESKPVQIKIVE